MVSPETIKAGAIKKWRVNSQKGFPCGVGSTIKTTIVIREFLERVIVEHNIKSISDAACGDYSWMKLVNKYGASYVGYDINDEMLKNLNYENVKFECIDITKSILPKTDLIICRDCLFHLTTENGVKAIDNFKHSGSKYLMSTTYDINDNVEIDFNFSKKYGFRKVNLKIDPYKLGEPIDRVYESDWNRFFCLWRMNG